MTPRTLARLVAVGLILSVPQAALAVPAGPGPVRLYGAILNPDGTAPPAGGRLHAADPASGAVFTSTPTDEVGNFELDGLRPAVYELAVESEGGLYPIEGPLQLAPGASRNLNITINREEEPAPTETKKKKRSAGWIWNNPATAALLVVGAAIVIGVLIDAATNDTDTSPTAP